MRLTDTSKEGKFTFFMEALDQHLCKESFFNETTSKNLALSNRNFTNKNYIGIIWQAWKSQETDLHCCENNNCYYLPMGSRYATICPLICQLNIVIHCVSWTLVTPNNKTLCLFKFGHKYRLIIIALTWLVCTICLAALFTNLD